MQLQANRGLQGQHGAAPAVDRHVGHQAGQSTGVLPAAPYPSHECFCVSVCVSVCVQENVNRLKAYKSNLVVFPRHRNSKKPKVRGGQGSGFCSSTNGRVLQQLQ